MVSIKSGLKPAIFRAVSIDIKRFVFFAIFLYLCLKHLPGEPFVKGLCGCLNGNDGSTIDEYAIVFTRGRINDVYVDAFVDVNVKGGSYDTGICKQIYESKSR